MNHLKKSIVALSLPVLISLNCQAMAAPAYFDSPSDLFYFDAHSLIWMLIGGAIVAAGVFLHTRSAREAAPPMRQPALPMPSDASSATSGEVPGQKSAGGEAALSMEAWISLDEATTVTVEELSRIEEEAEFS